MKSPVFIFADGTTAALFAFLNTIQDMYSRFLHNKCLKNPGRYIVKTEVGKLLMAV